jgi:hypothetical protein
VADDAVGLFRAPVTCDQTTQYDNRIEDEVEVELDDQEEIEDAEPRKNWGEIEQQFARYERNYRARRIRELTLAPIKKKRGAIRSGRSAVEAAI